ncbi:hypothetical protein HanXRQr2_Chr07g0292701 [Helianthus annuus]|uniref:Secreted protein n=1 Tax=Helianthus annuus TaxID=4232 RepID=A0A9K3IKR7_HELAN|nr:hypothetical protein HanXRQr2_Chr07g0292701 [Helianthus annuus]KAJ0904542.1 hypothetical protein HanPSC8_Chr07g0283451 [Helianthus annuus]
MFSKLLIFAYLMVDVAPWGHGGEGAGDPPPHGGYFSGTHETDAVPTKRVRGKAKNEKLRRLVKPGGGGSYRLRLTDRSRIPPLVKQEICFQGRPTCRCGGPSRSIKLDGITFHHRTRMPS